MAITVTQIQGQFQQSAGGGAHTTITSASNAWATSETALFLMALHHNENTPDTNRNMNSLTASAGTLGTVTYQNDPQYLASYSLGGAAGLAAFTTGATATMTATNDGDGSDSWITACLLKLAGHDTSTPFRQVKTAGTAAGGAASVSVTLTSAPLSDSLVVAVCVANNNNAWSLPSGFDAITGLAETIWGGYHATTWKNGGASQTNSFPNAGNTSGLGVTVFEIAAAGGGAPPGAGTLSVYSMGNGSARSNFRVF